MKWVSHFSIKFLSVTTAEPDHIQKTENQLAADGKKIEGNSFQDTEVTGSIQLHIWMDGTYGDSSSN